MINVFAFILLLVLAIGFLPLAIRYRFFSLSKEEEKGERVDIKGMSPLAATLLYIAVILGAGHASFLWLRSTFSDSDLVLSSLSQLVALFAAFVVLTVFSRLHSDEIRIAIWGQDRKGRSFFLGVRNSLIVYPIVMVFVQFVQLVVDQFGPFPQNEQVAISAVKSIREIPWLFWSFIVTIVAIVPVVEEILFRGFIQNYFVKLLGARFGIIIASSIFALFHYSGAQGAANVQLLSGLFMISYLMGVAFVKAKSLFVTIGMHATFNALSLLLFLNGPSP